MIYRFITCVLATVILTVTAVAEEQDSTLIITPSDTTIEVRLDSADVIELAGDSSLIPESQDSLSEISDSTLSFEERYEEYRKENIVRSRSVSYFDSLVTYFTSERLNMRSRRERSFYHDAGDYFRFDPSYFVLDHQVTPMRKTVQPFGLSGDRLNFVINGMPVHPLEHIVEPDGMVDMNDFSTGFDHDLYILPGPIGMLFGGHQLTATLVTLPKRPDGDEPETAILADKGSFEYSWVRGRYARRFPGGKDIDLSTDYRKAEGPILYRDDDTYHYLGDMYFPVGRIYGVRVKGQLYSRDGYLAVRPEIGGKTLSRDRYDRKFEVSIDQCNDDNTAHYEVGYKFLRQGSSIDGVYNIRINATGRGAFASSEWVMNRTIIRARVDGDHYVYDDWYGNYEHTTFDVSLALARLSAGPRFALTIGGRYEKDYSFLPSVALAYLKETSSMFAMISAGYSEREPSLHELYHHFKTGGVYGSSGNIYADQGNPELKSEKQTVGSIVIEFGSVDNGIGLSVTGGMIRDGIDWQNRLVTDGTSDTTLFTPENGDIQFVNVTIQPKLKISDFLRFTAGAAYHYLDYSAFENKAYQPDYQAFSGLELHYYWRQKLLDLFAYGEVVYVGPYDGYREEGLGNTAVVNVKLSLGLKDFRFHFMFQNMLSQSYRSREYITNPGRFTYYGLVWNFLN